MAKSTIPKNWLWNVRPVANGRVVVFDLDGVLCNADGRQHFITAGRKDWKAFFEACSEDQPIEETTRLLRLFSEDVVIVLLTGRPLEVQEHTVGWLESCQIPWDLLIMRNRGDYADSTEFKQQTVRTMKAMGFDIQIAFEDDPHNHAMYEAEGIPCHYRHSGYYEVRDSETREMNPPA